jgi:UDP-N-acetylmuramoyl-L-alanyl-D-glutamate--2,6-diaminopimelate ligase
LEKILRIGRHIIPKSLFKAAQPIYHYLLAILGAVIYRFPAKKMTVIGVTGTKGKTTTVELVNAILEKAGYKTALASTLKYKIDDKQWRNLFKMTLRGRFFTQKFLRQALDTGCTHAIIEVSSEGVPQSRHKFLFLDAVIFTNIAPEHIESHGSYEKYLEAKLTIAKELINHKKKKFTHGPILIANKDDKESEKFLDLNIINKIPYSLHDAISVKSDEKGSSFQIGKIVIHSKLPGIFNVSNMLAAAAYAKFAGISDEAIKNGLESVKSVRGRMEKIDMGQNFDVIVDYAHTPDSLTAAYETYKKEKYYIIGILGNTGGGRDKWKREEMGKIADKYCNQIILTNEDPYDEDPITILEDMKKGIKKKPLEIILDRREAINKALNLAQTLRLTSLAQGTSDKTTIAVLITGKGTDPYIMGPKGTKQEWDDATVVREELQKVLNK